MSDKTFSGGTAYELLQWLKALRAKGADLHNLYVETSDGTLADFEIVDVVDDDGHRERSTLVVE